ncbi:hypothetical protein HUU53_02965 [Candidatus Micrarchaeota archaeon]|nr:hypothetical protein [Candidatus Micrarchaeota archaeon]
MAGRKLFCYCEFDGKQSKEDFVLTRKLASVTGETGEVDAAVAFESAKQKTFHYSACLKNSCLVEADEEPPLAVSQDALNAVLVLSHALNARVLDEVYFMRKLITDGSNTTGFQRTALIAVNGFIETSKGKVGIQSIALEEDSAGIIEKTEKESSFRLDRLGVPLIEIATAPEIRDGEHAKETAELIGKLLRDSGLVQRGLGTIRQDLNVSTGGERVELKGVQDLDLLPKIIDEEVSRQKKEGVKKGGETRMIEEVKSKYMRPLPGSARMYPETDVLPLVMNSELLEKNKTKIVSSQEKISLLLAQGVSKQLAEKLASSKEYALFEYLIDSKADAQTIAATILETLVSLRREKIEVEKISSQQLFDLFSLYATKKIVKTALIEVLKDLPSGKTPEEVIKEKNLRKFLPGEVRKLITLYPDKKKAFGEIMRTHRLNVDPVEVQELLRE